MTTPEFSRQYEAARQAAAVADLSLYGHLEVSGPDRLKFLQNFSTNDLQRLAEAEACETFFCNVQGKIVGYGVASHLADHVWLETAPNTAESLHTHLDRYLIREDVELHVRDADWGLLAVCGPAAEEVLGKTLADFAPLAHQQLTSLCAGELPVIVRRGDSLGPCCYHLRLAREDAPSLLESLQTAGAVALDREVADVLRVERGTPVYGADITTENLPQEVGRDALAISFTKGCYLGQETVARIDALGHVNWLLRGLRFAEATACPPREDLEREGKRAGKSTSVAWSPAEQQFIGLGYVRREHAQTGTILESSAGPVEVCDLPFPAAQ